eukprot:8441889-Pyramimonas_sp.AAC.1
MRRRKRGDAVAPVDTEVDWRAILRPAGAPAESFSDAGSGSGRDTSDDEEVWWKQTWYGGVILRGGDPSDT